MSEAEEEALREEARGRARAAAIAKFARWSVSDAASTVGALTLERRNTHHLGSLKTWGALIASAIPNGKRSASREATKALAKDLKAWVGWADDAAATSHTGHMTFYGGDYTFFLDDPTTTFALQRVYETVATLDDDTLDVGPVKQLLWAAALVSNEIAKRVGVHGYEGAGRYGDAIEIPSEAKLRQWRKAVTFLEHELEELLGRFGLNIGALELLLLAPDAARPVDDKPFNSRVVEQHPIVKFGSRYPRWTGQIRPVVDGSNPASCSRTRSRISGSISPASRRVASFASFAVRT